MIETLRQIGLFSRQATTAANHEFAMIGLNNNRFQYLLRICERPGLFFDELAGEMAVDRTTSFRAVQKLIKDGYVEKRADAQNKKVRHLFPTTKAQAVYPQIHQFEQQMALTTVGQLSDAEQVQLATLMQKASARFY